MSEKDYQKLELSATDWANHVLTPTPALLVPTNGSVTIPCDWSPCPLSDGTNVSLWIKADIEGESSGNNYRVQWSAHKYDGKTDMSAQRMRDGLRVNWIATQNLAAPVLTLRVLNGAPPMTVRELALMRSDNMTAAWELAAFAEWYNLT